MGSRSGTPSIIAKLMGLDDLPPQHPVQKHGRVLSEKYFQRVASIGLQEKRSSHRRHSFRISNVDSEVHGGILKLIGTPKKSVTEELLCLESEGKRTFMRQEADFLIGAKPQDAKTFKHACLTPTDIIVLRPFSVEKVGDTKNKHLCGQGIRSTHLEVNERSNACDEIEIVGQRPRVSREEVEEVAKQMKLQTGWFSPELLKAEVRKLDISNRDNKPSIPSFLSESDRKKQNQLLIPSANGPYLVEEAKQRISERWKTTKEFREVGLCRRGRTLREMLSVYDLGMDPRNTNSKCNFGYSDRSTLDHGEANFLEVPYSWSIKPGSSSGRFKHNSERKDFGRNERSQQRSCGTVPSDLENNTPLRSSYRKHLDLKNKLENENLSGQTIVMTDSASIDANMVSSEAEVDSVSKDAHEDSLQQEFHETLRTEVESVSSHCSSTDPEPFKGLEDAYHPSPDSVLEIYKEGMPSYVNSSLYGVDLLDLEYPDSISEGQEIIVSSDEDSEDHHGVTTKEIERLIGLLSAEESRDFCYLMDILAEAGIHGKSSDGGLATWHCLECPIDSLVFETLEKNYSGQKSWKRSERRLLFDSINLGLVENFHLCMGMPSWEKPVSMRMVDGPGDECIEEFLWTSLIKQEKQARKESPEKDLPNDLGWLDLGECIDFIGREIERLLVDELVEEVISY